MRGTVGWVMARFEESTDFAALSASTRTNYKYCAKAARDYHTQNGRGPSLDTLYVDRLRLPVIQGVIETLACRPIRRRRTIFCVTFIDCSGGACGMVTVEPIPRPVPSRFECGHAVACPPAWRMTPC